MNIREMMTGIANAQDTMYGIKDLGVASFFARLRDEIEHAYEVMRPM